MLKRRIELFIELGLFLKDYLSGRNNVMDNDRYAELDELVEKCFIYNGWFTKQNVLKALGNISTMLNEKDLRLFSVSIHEPAVPKKIAVIMAGNIPAVGFHDFLCVFLSGHRLIAKLSSADSLLIPFFASFLNKKEPSLEQNILFADAKLSGFDAVIATGSNNTSVYFENYFGKYPHIIRKNRSSAALLNGKESREDLAKLGSDIFDYFGLGCRNVSKLFVPAGYNFNSLFEALFSFGGVMDNKKYANNYEYNRAVYLLNLDKFLDNNFLLVKESDQLHSPVGALFFEQYTAEKEIKGKIAGHRDQLQCLVTSIDTGFEGIRFGESQSPSLFDFSDNINTLAFLDNLS